MKWALAAWGLVSVVASLCVGRWFRHLRSALGWICPCGHWMEEGFECDVCGHLRDGDGEAEAFPSREVTIRAEATFTPWFVEAIRLGLPGPKLSLYEPDSSRECRLCGCTDERACPGGCWWVQWDLCSACEAFLIVEEAS